MEHKFHKRERCIRYCFDAIFCRVCLRRDYRVWALNVYSRNLCRRNQSQFGQNDARVETHLRL